MLQFTLSHFTLYNLYSTLCTSHFRFLTLHAASLSHNHALPKIQTLVATWGCNFMRFFSMFFGTRTINICGSIRVCGLHLVFLEIPDVYRMIVSAMAPYFFKPKVPATGSQQPLGSLSSRQGTARNFHGGHLRGMVGCHIFERGNSVVAGPWT